MDWQVIKVFLMGWGISGLFWIPLTILLMRVMAQMGVAQSYRAIHLPHAPIWAFEISRKLKRFIYGSVK